MTAVQRGCRLVLLVVLLLPVHGSRPKLKTPLPPSADVGQIANHTMVFVGGAAHSGTSLMRTLLASCGDASGQELCAQYVQCPNVEGQWMIQGEKRSIAFKAEVYRPGDSKIFLTEANLTDTLPFTREEAVKRLWTDWSRYWDMRRPFLVEKSPTNLGKVRWLDAVFQDAVATRFVLIVKDPVTNARFEKPKDSSPDRPDELMALRLRYMALWVHMHETVLEQLSSWDPHRSHTRVRIVRYEQTTMACTCENIFRFAFSDDEGKLLVDEANAGKMCNTAPKCDDTRRRQLNLQGGTHGPDQTVIFRHQASSQKRVGVWLRALDGLRQDQDAATLDQIEALDRRVLKFGYSVLTPGEISVQFGNPLTDIFAPWSLP